MTHPLASFWDRLGGTADIGRVDFPALHAKARPNRYLVVPAGLSPDADADAEAPAFGVPVETLRDAFRVAVFAEPYAQVLVSEDAQDRYVVRSKLLGFPDDVVATFSPLAPPYGSAPGDEASTLAVLSQSRLGHSDFGANKARVERVLARLKDRLPVLGALSNPTTV